MRQAEFEALSRKLMNILQKVKDDQSLLKLACLLLDATVAILVERKETGSHTYTDILSIYSPDTEIESTCKEEFKSGHKFIREWYHAPKKFPAVEGYTKEGPLTIAGLPFSNVLVAFGGIRPDEKHSPYELLLLNDAYDDKPFRSYHCWAAACLLRQFEAAEFYRILVWEEKYKNLYAAALTKDVSVSEAWEELNDRVKDKEFIIRWKLRVIWAGKLDRLSQAGDRTDDELFKKGDSLDALIKEKSSGKDKEIANAAIIVLKYLVQCDRDEEADQQFKELQNLIKAEEPDGLARKDDQLWYLFKAVALEHAWRLQQRRERLTKAEWTSNKTKRVQNSGTPGGHGVQSEDGEQIRKLVKLTRGFVIDFIIKKCQSPDQPKKSELGRSFLRLYLATMIAGNDSRLIERYLPLMDNSGNIDERHPCAPDQLRRTFRLNLSRFMLGVISVVEERLGLDITAPPVISSNEAFDSLLYLVDRYVHVELKVDERLNLKEKLGRQIGAEVMAHLSKPRYRDHLQHVIDVFLLGHMLLNTRIHWLGNETHPLVDHLNKQPFSKEDWMRNWAVASLFHDIGYQLGQGESISHDPKVWKKFFALSGPVQASCLSCLSFNEDGPSNTNASGSENHIQSITEKANKLLKKAGLDENWIPEMDQYMLRDHGVLSALRVAQILYHAENQSQIDGKNSANSLCRNYRHAVHAIFHHNLFNFRVSFDTHPLACLLRLCDELQEWGRLRVDIEKVVKNLYIDLQEGQFETLPSYEMFESFQTNLIFEPSPDEGFPEVLKIRLEPENRSCFQFHLKYYDAIKAQFDPMITLLSKAYNLQNIDLSVSSHDLNELKASIKLSFPAPTEYGGLTEYDIYGLFTEEVRCFPLLRQFKDIDCAKPGMIYIKDNDQKESTEDCFGIVVSRASGPGSRYGWLPSRPDDFVKRYLAFKEKLLASARYQ